jgi:hypothetical protein
MSKVRWVSILLALWACLGLASRGWAVCGDGVVDGIEVCDTGPANGTATSCCTNLCEYRVAGATCRPAGGPCDVAETCTGTSGDCPADVLRPSNFICRAVAGPCDAQETCTGSSAACPADDVQPAGTFCRPAVGVCDLSEFCNGTSVTCPADAKSTAECRSSAGICDPAENCDGSGNDCPPDVLASSSTVCRPVAADCDVAETCTGSSAACPADGFAPSTTLCRASAGVCDPAENCTGTSAVCPADLKSTAQCRPAAGVCDVAESCDGIADDCPPDGKSTAPCRAAGGACDVEESCDGVGDNCPPDGFAPSSTVCRPAAGVCDLAENCSGSGPNCPADAKSTGVCRAVAGACDVADSCDGVANTCPPDAFTPVGTVCRPAATFCDVAESCTGLGPACPADAFLPDGTPCSDGIDCTADACSGGVCVGTPDLDVCQDEFLCYKTKTTQAIVLPTVSLMDQFESGSYVVVKGKQLCVPANNNGSGIVDPVTHLRSYQIRPASGTPRHQRQLGVKVENAFGELHVDTVKPDLLLVPANKDLDSPPPMPDPQLHDVDHYKCYKIKVTPGTPPFPKGVAASLSDQFTNPPKSLLLKKPRHLCNPVEKNGEPIKNPTGHFLCYKAKGGVPKHVHRSGVQVATQFGVEVLDTVKEDEVCIPSTKSLSPSGAFLDTFAL